MAYVFSYQVFDNDGRMVFHAPPSCRYDKGTERQLLESGHTIRLNGRKISKKEVK